MKSNLSNALERFQKKINNRTVVNMHPPLKKGDHIIGVYVDDGVQKGIQGLANIIIIEEPDGARVGVWRSAYIHDAMQRQNAKHGDFVSIRCTGHVSNERGYRYPKLEIIFDDSSKYDNDEQSFDEVLF